jgi:membrane protein
MSREKTRFRAKPIDWRSPQALKELAIEFYHEIQRDKVTNLAAAVAYNTVFAIPAILLLIVFGAAIVNRVTDVSVTENLKQAIQDHAPANTQALLNQIVDDSIAKVGGGSLSVGLVLTFLIALWSGSNAISSMITAFNLAYGVEDGRSWIKRKLTTFELTILLAFLINLSFSLLVFGQKIGEFFADKIGAGSAFNTLWNLARWPLGIAAIMIFLAVLYYRGPDVEQSFRWISPGSAVATILWLLATFGIGIYLQVSNPGSAYGVVGSVLVLLFFLYVSALIFIVGAELNALLATRYDPKTVEDLASKPEAEPETRKRAIQRQRQIS